MKKRHVWNFILLIVLVLLAVQIAFAVELNLPKENYFPEQTLQTEFTGTFVSFSSDNIRIYEEGIPRPTPVVSDLTKQDDIYYYYAVLPNKEGNFSLVIENAEYISEGEIKNTRIVRDFTIKKSNVSYLSISPGFIVSSKDFSIKVKSPYKNQKIIATIDSSNISQSLNLIDSEEKTLNFEISDFSDGRNNILMGSYIIPVFISKTIIPPGFENLVFFPERLEGTIISGGNYFFKVAIQNQGDNNISNIKFTNTLNAIIDPESIILLRKGDVKTINVTLPVSSTVKNNLTGEIIADYGDKTKTLEVFFLITTNNTKINLTGTTITPGLHCAKRGKICIYPEKCTKDTTESLEGPCCLGECNTPQPPADYSWIFGLVLLAVLAVIAFFVIKKARAKQKVKTTEQILDEKTKEFSGRMNPSPEKEVSGKLDRI